MALQCFAIPRVKNTWLLLLSREVTVVNDCVSDDPVCILYDMAVVYTSFAADC